MENSESQDRNDAIAAKSLTVKPSNQSKAPFLDSPLAIKEMEHSTREAAATEAAATEAAATEAAATEAVATEAVATEAVATEAVATEAAATQTAATREATATHSPKDERTESEESTETKRKLKDSNPADGLVDVTCNRGKVHRITPEQKKKFEEYVALESFIGFLKAPWKCLSRGEWFAVLGILVTLLSIFVACALAPHSTLAWSPISDTAVVNDESKHDSQIKVSVNDVQVENPHILRIKLGNVGNQPIKTSDFEDYSKDKKGLCFKTTDNSKILSVNVESTEPPTRIDPVTHVVTTSNGNLASLAPLSLNPGESVTLRILVENKPKEVCIVGHISGATIENAKDKYEFFKKAVGWYGNALSIIYPFSLTLLLSDLFHRIAYKRSLVIIVILTPVIAGVLWFIDAYLQMRAQMVF